VVVRRQAWRVVVRTVAAGLPLTIVAALITAR